jgi:NAD kinase
MRVFVQFEEEELDTELAKRFDRFDACACSALGGAVELLRSPSGTHLNLEASLAEEAEGAEGSASSCSPASRGAGVAAPIDFIVCLGGDGTMIFASSLFPFAIPPMVSFNLGSLGFLTPFSVKEYAATLERLLTSHDGGRPVPIELRMRLEGSVLRHDAEVGAREEPVVILNEVLVDRGPTAYMTMIDAYVNGAFLTTVQADGIIIATPTGSTAYSCVAVVPGSLALCLAFSRPDCAARRESRSRRVLPLAFARTRTRAYGCTLARTRTHADSARVARLLRRRCRAFSSRRCARTRFRSAPSFSPTPP